MRIHSKLTAMLVAAAIAVLSGCVQMPTEKQSVVDQRPQISFRLDASQQHLMNARVLVDELDMGKVGDFIDGYASLRVLPGTHLIKVKAGGDVLMMERAYLGDGVVRPFIVK
jgi:hypothetical protein